MLQPDSLMHSFVLLLAPTVATAAAKKKALVGRGHMLPAAREGTHGHSPAHPTSTHGARRAHGSTRHAQVMRESRAARYIAPHRNAADFSTTLESWALMPQAA